MIIDILKTVVLSCQVRLSLLKAESTEEGENFMKWVTLECTEIPVVTAAVVVEHKVGGMGIPVVTAAVVVEHKVRFFPILHSYILERTI